MSFIKFKDWLAEKEPTTEMTSSASAGGMTSTGDIAGFARPLMMGDEDHLVRRGKKAKKDNLPSTTD